MKAGLVAVPLLLGVKNAVIQIAVYRLQPDDAGPLPQNVPDCIQPLSAAGPEAPPLSRPCPS